MSRAVAQQPEVETLSQFTLAVRYSGGMYVCFAAREPRIWHVLRVPKRLYVLVSAKIIVP